MNIYDQCYAMAQDNKDFKPGQILAHSTLQLIIDKYLEALWC